MADETSNAEKGQPSGPDGKDSGTAGKGEIKVTSGSAEQGPGKLNPSAPGETGTTTKQE
jgi:hypothetical protein